MVMIGASLGIVGFPVSIEISGPGEGRVLPFYKQIFRKISCKYVKIFRCCMSRIDVQVQQNYSTKLDCNNIYIFIFIFKPGTIKYEGLDCV